MDVVADADFTRYAGHKPFCDVFCILFALENALFSHSAKSLGIKASAGMAEM